MNHSRSLRRIVLSSAFLLAASATTAHCEPWDPFGIQDHHEYMPFGPNGPKLTVSTPSPTKIRNGGNFNKKNRASAQHTRVAQRTTPSHSTNSSRQSNPSRTTRFDDLNLSVTMPSGPWTKLDPQQTGSRARYLISRGHPTIIISLAGERVGTEAGATNSDLLAESQAKMLSLPGGTIQPGGEQLTAGGIPGIAYEATVDQGQFTTYYFIWIAAHHGYTYKLAVYGDQTEKPAIDEAMRNFLAGIKQLQSNRVAHAGGNQRTLTR